MWFFTETLEQEISSRNLLAAKTMAGEVNRLLAGYRVVLEQTADSLNPLPSSTAPSRQKGLEMLLTRLPLFKSVKVLDRRGRIRSLAPFRAEVLGLDLSGHPFVQQAMTAGQPVWSQVYLAAQTGHPALSLAVHSKFGALVADLDLSVLQEITGEVRVDGR